MTAKRKPQPKPIPKPKAKVKRVRKTALQMAAELQRETNAELDRAGSKLAAAESLEKSLRDEIAHLKGTVRGLRSTIDVATSRIASIEEDCSDKSKTIQQWEDRCAKLRQGQAPEVQRLQAENARLRDELGKAQHALGKLREELKFFRETNFKSFLEDKDLTVPQVAEKRQFQCPLCKGVQLMPGHCVNCLARRTAEGK